jgi:hypothetical protein
LHETTTVNAGAILLNMQVMTSPWQLNKKNGTQLEYLLTIGAGVVSLLQPGFHPSTKTKNLNFLL